MWAAPFPRLGALGACKGERELSTSLFISLCFLSAHEVSTAVSRSCQHGLSAMKDYTLKLWVKLNHSIHKFLSSVFCHSTKRSNYYSGRGGKKHVKELVHGKYYEDTEV